jgi:hypothetical protein
MIIALYTACALNGTQPLECAQAALDVSSVVKNVRECRLYVPMSDQVMAPDGTVWNLSREGCIEADRPPARMAFWTPGAAAPDFKKDALRGATK